MKLTDEQITSKQLLVVSLVNAAPDLKWRPFYWTGENYKVFTGVLEDGTDNPPTIEVHENGEIRGSSAVPVHVLDENKSLYRAVSELHAVSPEPECLDGYKTILDILGVTKS